MTHSLLAVMPAGMQGNNKGTLLLSNLRQLLNGPPGVMEGLELPFYSSMPGVLGLPLFPLPLWCPVTGCVGDVAWLCSHHNVMSHPSTSASHDHSANATLVAMGVKMLVGGQPLKNLVTLYIK